MTPKPNRNNMMSVYALAFAFTFAFSVRGTMFKFGASSLKLVPTNTKARRLRLRTPAIRKNAVPVVVGDDDVLRGIGRSLFSSAKESSSLLPDPPDTKSYASRAATTGKGTTTSSTRTVVTTRTIIATTVTTDEATSTSTTQTEMKTTTEARSTTDTIVFIGDEEMSARSDHLRHHRLALSAAAAEVGVDVGVDEKDEPNEKRGQEVVAEKERPREKKKQHHHRSSRRRLRVGERTDRQKTSPHHNNAQPAEESSEGRGMNVVTGNDASSPADSSAEECKDDAAVKAGAPPQIILSNEAASNANGDNDDDENNGEERPDGKTASASASSPLGEASTLSSTTSTTDATPIDEDATAAKVLLDVAEQRRERNEKQKEKHNQEIMIETVGQRDKEKTSERHRHRHLHLVETTGRQRTRPHQNQSHKKSAEGSSEGGGMDVDVDIDTGNEIEGTDASKHDGDEEETDEEEADVSVELDAELQGLLHDEVESNTTGNSDEEEWLEGEMGTASPSSPMGEAPPLTSTFFTTNVTPNDPHGIDSNVDDDTGTAPATDPVVVEISDECNVTEPERLGDGVCDADLSHIWAGGYNKDECGWDGGDCCWQTCTDGDREEESVEYHCGIMPYDCLDPLYSGIVYNEEDEPDPQRRTERRALRALYHATNGEGWKDKGQWLNDTLDHCYWDWRIKCTGVDGYVWGIWLHDNDLNGTLASEVRELVHLESLSFDDNPNLSGTIPAFLGNLTRLTLLSGSGTSLSGTIPASLGNLTQLKGLWVYDTSLSGTVPASLGNLMHLIYLGVDDTLLRGAVPANLMVPIFGTPAEYYDPDHWPKYSGLLSLYNCTDVDAWLDAQGHGCDWYANASTCVGNGMEHDNVGHTATTACCSCGVWWWHAREREVLEELYRAMNGDEWHNQSAWGDNGTQHCNWAGITCDDELFITHIILASNGLRGRLDVGDLLRLETLDVSDNQVTGEIPAALYALPNLKILDMRNNSLAGPLSTQIASLSLLRHLDLSHNELTGPLPEGLHELTLMEDLRLTNNTLTGTIAPEIRNLGRLKRLDLDHNLLCGTIPVDIGLLSRLRELRLSNNGGTYDKQGDWLYLDGPIPVELGDLRYLRILDLFHNALSGNLPTELGRLARIESIFLHDNNFEGYIPSEYGQLSMLESLTLNNDCWPVDELKLKPAPLSLCLNDAFDLRLDQLWCPPERNALKRLYDATNGNDWTNNANWTDQYGDHCAWYGVGCDVTVPCRNVADWTDSHGFGCDWVGVCTWLGDKRKNHNHTAKTACCVCQQEKYGCSMNGTECIKYVITSLTLSNNGLSGPLPPEIGDLSFLERLRFDHNRLIGSLPAEIFNLTNLQLFDVSSNTLSGEFPSDIATLPSLSRMFLSNNEFSGELAIPFTDESRIERIHIANNKFAGDISNTIAEFQKLPYLHEVDLSYNTFSGSMPPAALRGLTKIVLMGNERLISPIPSTLCHDPDIDLDLQDSPLHCPVISFLKMFYNWTNLVWDSSTTNSICNETSWHGIVCDESNTSIVEIKLANNGLRGTLPSSFGEHIAALSLLRLLDLSHNVLSGVIPLDFTRLPLLEEVRLSHNNFGSTLPAQFSNLPRLKVLAMDNNNLNGTLPVEYGRLSSLRELRLSNNRVTPSFASSNKQHGLLGQIPFEWGDLASIVHLDLSRNFLTGEIPGDLGRLSRLSQLYLHDNNFTGPMPIELGQLVAVKKLTLRGNEGLTKPAPLSICGSNATRFDLGEKEEWCPSTRNSLKQLYDSTKGRLWTEQGSGNASWVHEHSDYCQWHGVECEGDQPFGAVSHLRLMSNSLSGTIPANLFQTLTSLRSLLLGDNMLGGTISTHIGTLTNLTTLHLGGNKLSGVVPKEISNLSNLLRVRLHDNRFTGGFLNLQTRTTVDPTKSECIADCGNPNDWYGGTPKCDSCTTCCNSLGMCHDVSRKPVIDISYEAQWMPWTLVITAIFISGAFLVLCSLSAIAYFLRNYFPGVPPLRRNVRHLCGEGSVYSFLLASFPAGWIMSIATVVVQSLVFLLFLYAADFDTESSDIRYTKRCPPNKSMELCESEDTRSALGWLVFSFIVFVKIAPDLINGFTLTYLSGRWSNKRCFCSSAVLVLVSLLAIWTSVFYNFAIATTNTELIINAVILLFVNEVDEMLFVLLKALLPQWTRNVIKDSEKFSTRLAMEHISNDSSEHGQTPMVDASLTPPKGLVFSEDSSSQMLPSKRGNLSGHGHRSPKASISSRDSPILVKEDGASSVSMPQADVHSVDQSTEWTKLEQTVAHLTNSNEELERRNKALETKMCDIEKIVSKLYENNQSEVNSCH